MTPIEEQFPLATELIKTEIASRSSDLKLYRHVMNKTPFYVLKAIEHHLQGEQ